MIELRMSKQTAQALYTLMTYAVPSTSSFWKDIADMYETMSNSNIFSDSSPYEDASFSGFAEIDYWRTPKSLEDTITLIEDGL